MKNCVLVIVSLLLLVLDAGAVNPLDAASRVALARRHSIITTSQPQFFRAFVSVDDVAVVSELRRQGVKVSASLDGFVIADIPAEALSEVAALAGVRKISLARHLKLCNDTARYLVNVNPLHHATTLVAPLTGKGVIVGVIDTGIDFNHINLCDREGRSRVRAVYMPEDDSGTAPIVKGDTLPGSCYETPWQIAALTTDYPASSHGTHTTGTVAGGCDINGWYGMAPDADIVVCGIPAPELTDVNILSAVMYIFDYADRVGKPCVINLSIGSNGGPNDGSSYLCRAFNDLTGPGRICVVSAGNDGNAPICLRADIKGVGDTVTTLLRNQWGGLQRQGFVSAWSDGAQCHRSRLVVINRATGALEYASPFMGLLPEDSVFSVNSTDDADFARYYDGEVLFASALEPRYDNNGQLAEDGRYNAYWMLDATSVQAGHLLGVQYVADEPVSITAWTSKTCYFYTFGIEGVTGGQYSGSISDMATTDSVISVGAYCSRGSYVANTGDPVHIDGCNPGDIAAFSSFGPDEHGITRPDICAPGMVLMSSASRYDTVSSRQQWPVPVIFDGVEYPYYVNQGTSMSSPLVAGAIALMLQANPELSTSPVRKALRSSAIADSYVTHGNPEQWGCGKLDATAAVDHVIRTTLLPGDVNNDHEVNIADVMTLIDIILSGEGCYDEATLLRADVNRDCEILIADVNCIIDLIFK